MIQTTGNSKAKAGREEKMKQIKKEFQKVIGTIRKDNDEKSFPKPMMTAVQMEKREATVNCGGEWSTAEKTLERANAVIKNDRFIDFINKHNATAKIEKNNFNTYQIRIYFNR